MKKDIIAFLKGGLEFIGYCWAGLFFSLIGFMLPVWGCVMLLNWIVS